MCNKHLLRAYLVDASLELFNPFMELIKVKLFDLMFLNSKIVQLGPSPNPKRKPKVWTEAEH